MFAMKMVVVAVLLLVNMCLQSVLATLLIYRNHINNLLFCGDWRI